MDYSLMLKEGRGAFSRLKAPGVFDIFNNAGELASTATLIDGGYVIKFHGVTRAEVYAERALIRAGLEAEQAELLSEEEYKGATVPTTVTPNWV